MIHRQQHGRNENRAQNTGLGKAKQRDTARGHLHRCHVVEGMVQLLANGFVLELLSIQFIWRSEVDRKFKQVPRTAGAQEAGGEARGRWRRRREGGRRRQTLVRVLKRTVLITERPISGLVCGSPVGLERGRLSDSPVNLHQLCTEHCRPINMWVRVSRLQRGSHGFRCSFGKQTTCVCLPDFG